MFDNLEELSICLAEHSKETFWLESSDAPRCLLEQLAKSVYLKHTQSLRKDITTCNEKNTQKVQRAKNEIKSPMGTEKNSEIYPVLERSGCEWWVQVKDLSDESSSKNSRLASKVRMGCCDDHDDGESQNNHDHTHHYHNHNNNHDHYHSKGNDSINNDENNDKNDSDHSHYDNDHTNNNHSHNDYHRNEDHSHNCHNDSHDHDHNSSNHHDNKSKKNCDHNHNSHYDCNTRYEGQIDDKNDMLTNTNTNTVTIENGNENENENENENKNKNDIIVKENGANITEKSRNPDLGSVCLHYDKDEELASNFGIGIFPQLSTVTYLSRTKDTAPTVILERYPKDPVAQSIHKCYVSYPARGKHVRFDGLYLHGACPQFCDSESVDDEFNPENSNEEDIDVVGKFSENDDIHVSNLSLETNRNENTNIKNKILVNKKKKYRVTFLVNIWINHKPLKVENLSNEICEKLIEKEKEMIIDKDIMNDIFISNNDECRTKICTLNINEKIVTNEDNGTWVDIPFITDDSDWGKDHFETDLFLRIWAPSANFFEKNIKKMMNSKILKTALSKKKVVDNKNKKKSLNINKNKSKVESGLEESEETVTTFEINYLDDDCCAFFLYDEDDMSEDEDGDGDGDGE